jgi:hypothetical protein
MKQDEMIICECIEYLDSMVGDDENIKGCLDYIERKAKAMDKKLREYKSIFEEKQETNLDYYKDEILEKGMWNLAVVDGRPKRCNDTMCRNCDFTANVLHGCRKRLIEWLKQIYIKPKYKLTQFEYDLLSVHKDYKTYNQIANQIHLFKMHEKGYFKYIDTNIPIREILDNCEVV